MVKQYHTTKVFTVSWRIVAMVWVAALLVQLDYLVHLVALCVQ